MTGARGLAVALAMIASFVSSSFLAPSMAMPLAADISTFVGRYQGRFTINSSGACPGTSGTWTATFSTRGVQWYDSYNKTSYNLTWGTTKATYLPGYDEFLLNVGDGEEAIAVMGNFRGGGKIDGKIRGPKCDPRAVRPSGTFEGSLADAPSPTAKPQAVATRTPTRRPEPTAVPTPKPQPTNTPAPKPTLPPTPTTAGAGGAATTSSALMAARSLEDLVPILAVAQEDIRRKRERLAKYDEAVAKQDLSRLRAHLEDDMADAQREHKELRKDLLSSVPGILGEYAGLSARLAAIGQSVELARLFNVSPIVGTTVAALDAVVKAPLQMAEGWQKLSEKEQTGERVTEHDLMPFVEGLVTIDVAMLTRPGGALERTMKRGGSFWATGADVLMKTSMIAINHARYWDAQNNAQDIANTQRLQRQRYEIELQKAEMREQQVRSQVRHWRKLSNESGQ